MQRTALLIALVMVGGGTIGLASYQQAQAPRPVVRGIEKVRDNLYFISGGDTAERKTWTGGNTLVFVTERGVILVDTMLPGFGAGILERVRSVSDKPVVSIINTHTHFDHSGSNVDFPATVEFIAHEGTRAQMARTTCEPVTNCGAFKGENAKFLPKRTYKDKTTIGSGRDQVDLYHFGRGHTNGDSFVVFPSVRAMHTGDMFQRLNMPFIDVANSGGSAVEFNRTLQRAVTSIKGVDTVIGGHTPSPVTWNDFKTFTDFYRDFFTAAEQNVKAGRSAEEFIRSYQPGDKYKSFQIDPMRVRDNAQAIYAELKK